MSLKSRLKRLEAQAAALPRPPSAAEQLFFDLELPQQCHILEILEARSDGRPLPYGLAAEDVAPVFASLPLGERRARLHALLQTIRAAMPPEGPPPARQLLPTHPPPGGSAGEQPDGPDDRREHTGPPPERKPPAVMPLRLPPPVRPRNPDVFGVPERFWKRC
jgi:hypothetical protein